MNQLKLTFTFLTGLTLLWNPSASAAETVKEVILNQGKWQAAKITDQALTRKDACVAQTFTPNKDASLQLYAEEVSPGKYAEPTVLVTIRKPMGDFFRGIFVDGTETAKYHMTLGSIEDQTVGHRGLIARLKDRRGMAEAIKKANTLYINLYDAKGKMFKAINFSLSGSSKTVDAMLKACNLVLPVGESKF